MRLLQTGALGVATALIACAASAQTTTCENKIYGMPQFGVTCRTSGGYSSPATQYDPATVEPRECSFEERHIKGVDDALCSARAVAAKRKAVGELLAQGRCPEAVKAALALGDIAYAQQVRAFCANPPGQ
jgi:hypothetical protein